MESGGPVWVLVGDLGNAWDAIFAPFKGLGGTESALGHFDGPLGCPSGALWELLWGSRGAWGGTSGSI